LEDTWSYTGNKHKSAGEVISLLVSSAQNNGNLLLSIGPHWAGDFDLGEMATMQEVGQWLGRYGASIYGTRGGPWTAYPWGGSTYRGATAYVHAHGISGEKIEMQMLKAKRIRSVRLLNCASSGAGSDDGLEYAIKDGRLAIEVPAGRQDKIDTIIEIQFYQDLTDVAPIAYGGGDRAGGGAASSPFDYETIYGPRLQSGVSVTASSLAKHDYKADLANVVTNPVGTIRPFSTSSQIGAQIDVALDAARYVTGIGLSADAQGAQLQLHGSIDGKTWTLLWHSPVSEQVSSWDIDINGFDAGAETPGRLLRFLRIKVQGAEPKVLELRRFHIWAKEAK
jgi:hypothetical protein